MKRGDGREGRREEGGVAAGGLGITSGSFLLCSSLHLTFSSFFHVFIFKRSLALAFSTAGFFFCLLVRCYYKHYDQ